ncbi:MAG TPA: hypothetical protein VMB82_04110 [Acidimicrobiales bacterium]|nr:hypothetical protein [Acidimicrobiales bacterium]
MPGARRAHGDVPGGTPARREWGSSWRTAAIALLACCALPVGAASLVPGRAEAEVATTGVVPFGDAGSYGTPTAVRAPLAGMAATPDGHGYWLVGADGGVFAYGDASFYGSAAATPLAVAVVGMARTADGRGYWEVTDNGAVFAYGDAASYGGPTVLDAPLVGMAATPDGHGYWLVAADGGVFSFGDAAFFGSMGGRALSQPVVGMAATPDGHGYWVATADRAQPPGPAVPSVLDRCDDPTAGPAIEPPGIVLSCADGNAFVSHLAWSSWSATGADATGVYTQNGCVPDCAEGTFASFPARIELRYPIETSAGREFSTITYSYADALAPGGRVTRSAVIETSAP